MSGLETAHNLRRRTRCRSREYENFNDHKTKTSSTSTHLNSLFRQSSRYLSIYYMAKILMFNLIFQKSKTCTNASLITDDRSQSEMLQCKMLQGKMLQGKRSEG